MTEEVGVNLVKRIAERLRQQMDNKGGDGGLPLRPVLPFILATAPARLENGCSGTRHKGFSITHGEHLCPETFYAHPYICSSATGH